MQPYIIGFTILILPSEELRFREGKHIVKHIQLINGRSKAQNRTFLSSVNFWKIELLLHLNQSVKTVLARGSGLYRTAVLGISLGLSCTEN